MPLSIPRRCAASYAFLVRLLSRAGLPVLTCLACCQVLGACGGNAAQEDGATPAQLGSVSGAASGGEQGGGDDSGAIGSGEADDDNDDDDNDDDDNDDNDDNDDDDDEDDDSAGPKFDVGAPEEGSDDGDTDCEESDKPTPTAFLEGVVYAPNGELPISGALVYAVDGTFEVETIPDHVYCPECVELPCEIHFVLTEPDGSFRLPTLAGDNQQLVVGKGQFLQISSVDIPEGDSNVGGDVTSLPDRRDPSQGMYIPNMAVGLGAYDRLEDALAKLGVADVAQSVMGETLDPGTQQFDIWDNAGGGVIGGGPALDTLGPMQDLLTDREKMDKYHIIFFPCTSADQLFENATVVDNVRGWVADGGKLYAADWANEAVAKPFPQYQTFATEAGSADLFSAYNTVGQVLDEDMLAWLNALPDAFKDINPQNAGGEVHPKMDDLPNVDLWHNWSVVLDTPSVEAEDEDGEMVEVGHYIWAEGTAPGMAGVDANQVNPMTMTGQYGCGKLMFTTYHTAENIVYNGLAPQELVLMYLILEITVCTEGPSIIPPE